MSHKIEAPFLIVFVHAQRHEQLEEPENQGRAETHETVGEQNGLELCDEQAGIANLFHNLCREGEVVGGNQRLGRKNAGEQGANGAADSVHHEGVEGIVELDGSLDLNGNEAGEGGEGTDQD